MLIIKAQVRLDSFDSFTQRYNINRLYTRKFNINYHISDQKNNLLEIIILNH